MADSNITKRALAAALKSLLAERPFAKVSVREICEACGMSRKSFYYHFKDKYELLNWIFETEFVARVQQTQGSATPGSCSTTCAAIFMITGTFTAALLRYRGRTPSAIISARSSA